jgi:hypothetical protein
VRPSARTSSGCASTPATGSITTTSGPIAALPHVEELNIGFAIVARALFEGVDEAVGAMARLVRGRQSEEGAMIVEHARCRLQGSLVALPTPFWRGEVDWGALGKLIEWHIAQKSDGLVIAGTTGEAATLTEEERRGLFDLAVSMARGRIPIVAGVGTNCTRTTVGWRAARRRRTWPGCWW